MCKDSGTMTEHAKDKAKHEARPGDARRKRLQQIQRELEQVDAEAGRTQKPAQLNEVLGKLLSKKQRRKHQLRAIKEFFDDPSQFGVDAHDVPHSSTREEILERHAELTYRVRLLRSVLGVLHKEVKALDDLTA